MTNIAATITAYKATFNRKRVSVLHQFLVSSSRVHNRIVFAFSNSTTNHQTTLGTFSSSRHFITRAFITIRSRKLSPYSLQRRRNSTTIQTLMRTHIPLFRFTLESALRKFSLGATRNQMTTLQTDIPVLTQVGSPTLHPRCTHQLTK